MNLFGTPAINVFSMKTPIRIFYHYETKLMLQIMGLRHKTKSISKTRHNKKWVYEIFL